MNVTTVLSGQEAIEICRERAFGIVFMDHMMPGMDGIEAMKAIRADKSVISRDMPIVALTANAVSTAKEMFLSAGFDGFVSKPVELNELERVLKRVLPKSAIAYEVVSETDRTEESGFKGLKAAGIDTASGLRYSQRDEQLYNTLLKQFVTEAPMKRSKIREYYENNDFKDYEILVHALKSTAKMIGAAELSERSKSLEMLAKKGGADITAEMHDKMMELYKKTVNAVAGYLDIEMDADKAVEDAQASPVLEFEPGGNDQQSAAEPFILEFNPGGTTGQNGEGGEA
jgi:CheY-like chemotaxis protein